VTIPHKERVTLHCDELDDVAAAAGSVNTLVVENGLVLGSSTDGAAVTSQIDARDRAVLILGAGGSAKAVMHAVASVGPAGIELSSRRDGGWPPNGNGVDVLVNCTPVKDELIVTPHPGMQVVDLAYNADGSETALVAAARRAGCETVVDGLDVLLAQGAASFERWTGQPAPLAAMAAALHRS
jgi:shikimate dehydrogenase